MSSAETDNALDDVMLAGPAFTELREQAAYLSYRSAHAKTESEKDTNSNAERIAWLYVEKLFGRFARQLDKVAKKDEVPE